MSKIVQEKFEVRLPRRPEGIENTGWASDKSARVKKGTPNSGAEVMLTSLPPGMDIDDQEEADIRHQPECMSGESDVSRDYNPEAVHNGFTRREMRGTDDQYSNEHVDAFYGEATVDGKTGFLERNNMLDRL